MHLNILGTRGEVDNSAPWHSHQSGVLVDGSILLDVGELEYLDLSPRAVVITHLHPDHAFFVRKDREVQTDIPFYAPEKYHGRQKIRYLPRRLDLGSHAIRTIPTHHSLKVQSTALVVDDGSHRICYTGDMIWINKKFHRHIQNLDLVITDGSFIRKKGMIRRDRQTGRIYGHAGIPALIRLFSNFTGQIRFVHFGNWFYRDVAAARKRIRELGREYGVEARATRDGQEIEVGDLRSIDKIRS